MRKKMFFIVPLATAGYRRFQLYWRRNCDALVELAHAGVIRMAPN